MTASVLSRRVLVLSSSYQVINICNVKRAVLMLLTGAAQCVEDDPSATIRSPSWHMPVPEVIRVRRTIHIPFKEVTFCRKNVLLRDNKQCQYCGRIEPEERLTLDHVIPLSRGGKDHWTNVVVACRMCNNRKGSFTPEEAGMRLLRDPRTPSSVLFLHIARHYGQHRRVWHKYLYY